MDSFSVAGFQEEAVASMMLHRPATRTNPDETTVLHDKSMALFTDISARYVVPFAEEKQQWMEAIRREKEKRKRQ